MFSPRSEKFICGLKHRLLVFLYHRAVRISEQEGSPYELRRFYLYFNRFRSLRMWKMQLLDSHHLLIRYASEEVGWPSIGRVLLLNVIKLLQMLKSLIKIKIIFNVYSLNALAMLYPNRGSPEAAFRCQF